MTSNKVCCCHHIRLDSSKVRIAPMGKLIPGCHHVTKTTEVKELTWDKRYVVECWSRVPFVQTVSADAIKLFVLHVFRSRRAMRMWLPGSRPDGLRTVLIFLRTKCRVCWDGTPCGIFSGELPAEPDVITSSSASGHANQLTPDHAGKGWMVDVGGQTNTYAERRYGINVMGCNIYYKLTRLTEMSEMESWKGVVETSSNIRMRVKYHNWYFRLRWNTLNERWTGRIRKTGMFSDICMYVTLHRLSWSEVVNTVGDLIVGPTYRNDARRCADICQHIIGVVLCTKLRIAFHTISPFVINYCRLI